MKSNDIHQNIFFPKSSKLCVLANFFHFKNFMIMAGANEKYDYQISKRKQFSNRSPVQGSTSKVFEVKKIFRSYFRNTPPHRYV